MDRLPGDVWMRIWEYDPTYHGHFRDKILPEIRILRSKELARDYYDGTSYCAPGHFRFYQNNTWFTAFFEEMDWNRFSIQLINEHHGTFCTHLHHIPNRCLI